MEKTLLDLTGFDLKGRVAVVTGAKQGNGKAISDYLASLGADVARTDVAAGESMVAMDVTNEESVRSAMADIIASHGRIDILVNNAGLIYKDGICDLDIGQWRKVIDVNLTGPTICTKHASSHMKKNAWGRVINISSVQAFMSKETYSAYSASKAGLSHLTHIWAAELAPHNITVNALCPSYVETPMMDKTINAWKDNLGVSYEAALNKLLEPIPLKRLLRPEEIGYWVAVLCSEMGGGMTGSNLSVSCGWLLY